jgi:hypothetical protein
MATGSPGNYLCLCLSHFHSWSHRILGSHWQLWELLTARLAIGAIGAITALIAIASLAPISTLIAIATPVAIASLGAFAALAATAALGATAALFCGQSPKN